MYRPVDLLALLLLVLAVLCWLVPPLVNGRRPGLLSLPAVLSAILGLLALGGWLLAPVVAFWAGFTAAILLAGLIALLLLTGRWWPLVVGAVTALGVFALGGLALPLCAAGLTELGVSFFTVEWTHPLWLILLLLIPFLIVMARRSLGFVTPKERRLFWSWVFPALLLGPALYVTIGWVLALRWALVTWSLTDQRNVPRSHYLLFMAAFILYTVVWLIGCLALWRRLLGPRLPDHSWRPYLSLALRCAGLGVLALALSEPRLFQTNDNVTVLFVLDRSQSVPEDFGAWFKVTDRSLASLGAVGVPEDVVARLDPLKDTEFDRKQFLAKLADLLDRDERDRFRNVILKYADLQDPTKPGAQTDWRAQRTLDFINKAVEQRGSGRERDRAGLIVFGRRPRLELPPADAPRFNLRELPPAPDGNYTDIAAALKLALASFPEGTGKRIVLISDGNENLGNAEEQARLAQTLGVQIDTVPLASGQRNEDEVMVERVEAPSLTEQGANVPIRVLIRSFNPHIVLSRLILRQITEKERKEVGNIIVRLRQGLNSYSFTRPLTDEQRSYTYEAEIQPLQIEDEQKKVLVEGPPRGDRVQNNRASTHVVARGRRRILVLENRPADREQEVVNTQLLDKLRGAGERKFRVEARSVNVLNNYADREKLSVFLSDYDCVILVNVPAEKVSEEQQEALRSNTHDQGCGLVMIGGPESYGAGGWQNTAVEKALPVDSEIKSLEVQGKGGLVLIMHASEMAEGNFWQKKIAKLAIERLGPGDMVGVIDFSFQCNWHIRFQEVGNNRAGLLAQVDKMMPGDMPDFDPALQMAHKALTDPKHELTTKHVIVISDGDPVHNPTILGPFRRDKVSISTVGVACHGPNEDKKMELIAKATGGRPYSVKNPNQLPAIYVKESRLVSQSFVEERRFTPIVTFRSGPTDKLPDPPSLKGFVRTTAKPSPLVEVPIITPKFADMEFPLLAYWHYGLGKSVAFTSDAGGDPKLWARAWIEGGEGKEAMYAKFWEQVIEWSLRPTESNRLQMTTEYRDGKIRILIEARTDANQPDTELQLRGGVTTPGGNDASRRVFKFVQKNSGQYEAEIKAEDAGSYFITAQATRQVKVKGKDGKEHLVEEPVDSVRAGITLPYSPEFADLESNTSLLEKISSMTGGQVYRDDDRVLDETARSGAVFRGGLPRVKSLLPLWHWLVLLAGLLLFLDVAARRIAVDTTEVHAAATRIWARLRGLEEPEAERVQYLERLRNRKVRVDDALASRRYEGQAGAAPRFADATGMPSRPIPSASSEPSGPGTPLDPDTEAGDALDRLRQAKKKALEDRKKE